MLQKQHPEKLYFCQKANIKIRRSTRQSSRDTGERAIKKPLRIVFARHLSQRAGLCKRSLAYSHIIKYNPLASFPRRKGVFRALRSATRALPLDPASF